MLKKISFLLTFIILMFLVTNLYAEVNYYPAKLLQSINVLKKDFNKQSLNNVYNEFVNYKGIKDTTIAFTLVDIALNNKNKLDDDTISLITKFDIDNKKLIRDLLTSNYFNKFALIPKYISNFSIFVILKYVSSIFLILLLIALFIKNKFIFFHIHKEKANLLKLFYFLLFLLIPIAGISFYPDKAILFIAINATILLLPEKNNNKLILFIAIVVAIIINNVNFNVKLNKNINDYYSIINNPVSLEYLNYKIEQDPENYDLKVVRNIKYPKSSINLKGVPKNKFSDVGIVNLSIYYLMNKKFDKFKHLLKNNTLLKNPIILLNLSSYFTITFQYKELEDINLRLYNYEFYYKLAETYQHNTKNSLFIPYSGSKANIFLEKLNYNVQNIIIFLLILISVFVFIVYLSKLRELFKCDSCGNVFCAQCDDGYDSDQICATCRNIIFRKGNAEASILVKKTILMENYKQHLKIFSRILSAIIPGAGQIFINNPIKGIIMTTFFSIVLFILIFRFEPFIGPENYALNLIFTPLYIIIFGVFALIYILNIFRRK